MDIKTGVDIIEVNRIESSIKEQGDKFKSRVYTDKEIEYCEKSEKMQYQHYAGRFAAKEATFKAISTLLDDKYSISWNNIEITNDENGKPSVDFVDLDKDIERKLEKVISKDVSISHINDYATATVSVIIN